MTPQKADQMTPETSANISKPDVVGRPNGTPAEQLLFYENVVTRSLDREDQLAEAINQIKARKLYKVVHMTFRDYVTARWNLSRSRAYQLVRYAKLKEQARSAGKTPPANERLARNLGPDGTPLPPATNYKTILEKSKRHLKGALSRLTPEQRRKYATEIQIYIGLALNMDADKSAPNQQRASSLYQPVATAQVKEVAPSTSASNPTECDKVQSQTVPASSASASSGQGVKSSPANQIIPNPYLYGGVTSLTMAEARARGLINSR